MTFNVFISYSTKDLQIAKWLEQSLLGIKDTKVFLADSVLIVGSLSDALIREIKNCDLFIVLYSKDAHSSQYVQQEIGAAKISNKLIIPLIVHPDVKPGAMLEGLSYVKLYESNPAQLQQFFDYVNRRSQEKQNQINLAFGILAFYLISKNR